MNETKGEAKKPADRYKVVVYALLVVGGLMLLGGWGFDRAGNAVNMFPDWVPFLGTALIVIGAYYWLLRQ
jgi:hypothetical protein